MRYFRRGRWIESDECRSCSCARRKRWRDKQLELDREGFRESERLRKRAERARTRKTTRSAAK